MGGGQRGEPWGRLEVAAAGRVIGGPDVDAPMPIGGVVDRRRIAIDPDVGIGGVEASAHVVANAHLTGLTGGEAIAIMLDLCPALVGVWGAIHVDDQLIGGDVADVGDRDAVGVWAPPLRLGAGSEVEGIFLSIIAPLKAAHLQDHPIADGIQPIAILIYAIKALISCVRVDGRV